MLECTTLFMCFLMSDLSPVGNLSLTWYQYFFNNIFIFCIAGTARHGMAISHRVFPSKIHNSQFNCFKCFFHSHVATEVARQTPSLSVQCYAKVLAWIAHFGAHWLGVKEVHDSNPCSARKIFLPEPVWMSLFNLRIQIKLFKRQVLRG